MRWRAALLRCGGREELAIDAPGGAVRLSLESGTLLNGPVRLRYLLDGHRLSNRLAALQRWDRLCRTGTASPTSAATPSQAARWPLLVAALDAIADGSTLRQTANRLFGKERVVRDWHHESDYLKLRTRRLVTQARALAAGGYRALL